MVRLVFLVFLVSTPTPYFLASESSYEALTARTSRLGKGLIGAPKLHQNTPWYYTFAPLGFIPCTPLVLYLAPPWFYTLHPLVFYLAPLGILPKSSFFDPSRICALLGVPKQPLGIIPWPPWFYTLHPLVLYLAPPWFYTLPPLVLYLWPLGIIPLPPW